MKWIPESLPCSEFKPSRSVTLEAAGGVAVI